MENKISNRKISPFIISGLVTLVLLAVAFIWFSNNATANAVSEASSTQRASSIDDYLNTVDLSLQAKAFSEQKIAMIDKQQEARKAQEAKESQDKLEAERVAEEDRLAQESTRIANAVKEHQEAAEKVKADTIPVPAPAPEANPVSVPAPAVVPVAPVPVPAPAAVPVPAPAPVQNARQIHVGVTGGQAVIDSCVGPVLFNQSIGYPYIAEHENCGGWGRIGTLQTGMKVTLSGLVGGTYTVGKIIQVAQGADSNSLAALGNPAAALQTCIPGTKTMVVVGLY